MISSTMPSANMAERDRLCILSETAAQIALLIFSRISGSAETRADDEVDREGRTSLIQRIIDRRRLPVSFAMTTR
jgi:hypothetical protein